MLGLQINQEKCIILIMIWSFLQKFMLVIKSPGTFVSPLVAGITQEQEGCSGCNFTVLHFYLITIPIYIHP